MASRVRYLNKTRLYRDRFAQEPPPATGTSQGSNINLVPQNNGHRTKYEHQGFQNRLGPCFPIHDHHE